MDEWEIEEMIVGENGAVYTIVKQTVKPSWLWASGLLLVGFSCGAGFGWFVRPDIPREMIQQEIAIAVEAEHARADREIEAVKQEALREIAHNSGLANVAMAQAFDIIRRLK